VGYQGADTFARLPVLAPRLARRTIPILAALLSAASLSAAPAAAAGAGDCTPAASWPADRVDVAGQVVALVNAHRAQLGLAALVVSPTLDAAATWKARNMAAYGYMDHADPAPAARTAGERFAACGYPQAEWGEDLAFGYSTAQAVVAGWLSSPEHRANIERPEFRATGVGAAGAPAYWAQAFGVVADAGSFVAAPVAPASAAAGPTATAPSATAPSTMAAARPLRVSCAQHGRRVACRVRGQRGTVVRIALMRSGRTFARVRVRAASDAVRVGLHPMRRLRAGRYALIVRAGLAAGEREQRMSLVVH
jgi:uncharacterized protein YkwD